MQYYPVYSISPVVPVFPEPENPPQEKRHFIIFQGAEVLFRPGDSLSSVSIPGPLPVDIVPDRIQYLGCSGNDVWYAVAIAPGSRAPAGFSRSPVRELFGRVPDRCLALAAYGARILDFDRSTRFCGRCGHDTRALKTERAKLCTDCNLIVYPRLSPAILVLVKKDTTILLASSPRFPAGMHSILAGFVEPGENLDETVHREVREEVGIAVKNIRYLGSEPWPFPDSLMIGFVADYDGGELTIDNNEIAAAGWFTRDNLPPLPPSKRSLSRALIDAWIRQEI